MIVIPTSSAVSLLKKALDCNNIVHKLVSVWNARNIQVIWGCLARLLVYKKKKSFQCTVHLSYVLLHFPGIYEGNSSTSLMSTCLFWPCEVDSLYKWLLVYVWPQRLGEFFLRSSEWTVSPFKGKSQHFLLLQYHYIFPIYFIYIFMFSLSTTYR